MAWKISEQWFIPEEIDDLKLKMMNIEYSKEARNLELNQNVSVVWYPEHGEEYHSH